MVIRKIVTISIYTNNGLFINEKLSLQKVRDFFLCIDPSEHHIPTRLLPFFAKCMKNSKATSAYVYTSWVWIFNAKASAKEATENIRRKKKWFQCLCVFGGCQCKLSVATYYTCKCAVCRKGKSLSFSYCRFASHSENINTATPPKEILHLHQPCRIPFHTTPLLKKKNAE